MSKEILMQQLKDLQNTDYSECLVPGAEIIVEEARGIVHVISGALRDSIEVIKQDETVNIVAGIDYAADEEFRAGHEYLRPSIDSKVDDASKAIGDAVSKKMEEVV